MSEFNYITRANPSEDDKIDLECCFEDISGTSDGVKLPLFHHMSPKMIRIIKGGNYEPLEARGIGRILQEGDRVLELGVGIGYIATLILRDARVAKYLGFEANPQLADSIRWVFDMNGVAGDTVCGVLNETEDVTTTSAFYARRDFWASSLDKLAEPFQSVLAVDSYPWQAAIDAINPTLIVCDIEGAELDLFRAMDLSGVDRIYVEIHPWVYGSDGVREFFSIMGESGFCYKPRGSVASVLLFQRG